MEHQINENEFLVTNVKQGDMLWVRSRTFNCDCWGYATRLYDGGVEVRLELPDDHPSMVEAGAETGLDADNIELYDLVPFGEIEYIRYMFIPDQEVLSWKRSVTSEERAARARSRGFTRLSIPELDQGLRR